MLHYRWRGIRRFRIEMLGGGGRRSELNAALGPGDIVRARDGMLEAEFTLPDAGAGPDELDLDGIAYRALAVAAGARE